MAKRLMIVLAASAAISVLVYVTAGRYASAGAFAASAVVGALWVVLRRNRKDLHELEAGRVPGPVDRALGETPPPEP